MRLLSGLAICVCAVSALANPAQSRQAICDGVRYVSTVSRGPRAAHTSSFEKDPNAARIAAARRDARQGDIFTHEVAVQFHTIVRKAFRGPDARNMRRTIQEGDPATLSMLHVNDVYPEEIAANDHAADSIEPVCLLCRRNSHIASSAAPWCCWTSRRDVIVDFIPDAIP